MEIEPIAIVGAGASGLMAACWSAGRGRPVVLLEGTTDGGRKILASGGGRCNILPSASAPERFVTGSSPNILRKILRSWPLEEQLRFFEKDLGLALALETESGKWFPERGGARRVRDLILGHAREKGAELRFGWRAARLEPSGGAWRLTSEEGAELSASAVVLATGGLSLPETGSDGWGYEAARRLGHTVHAPYPALVPLVAEPAVHAHLAGVSLEVTAEAWATGRKAAARGGFLFTHKGYSGPVVLDLSHFASRPPAAGEQRPEIRVGWTDLDARQWEGLLLGHRGSVEALLARHVPSRLAQTLCRESGVEEGLHSSHLRRDIRLRLVTNLTRYTLPWTGDEGFAKAETTGGGVAIREVDPRTLESRLHPGLFFCGEVLDAFGPIGGHNFQWAWATGRAAGLGASRDGGMTKDNRALESAPTDPGEGL